MKRTNNLIALLLAAICVFSFAACKGGDGSSVTSGDSESTPTSESVADREKTEFVKNGGTEYKIIVPENATDGELKAADMFSSAIRESTTADVSVIGENAATGGKYVYIGRTAYAAKNGVAQDVFELNGDGYVLKTVGSNLIIYGAVDGGTFNGALGVLKDSVGYETYASDETYYKTDNNADLYVYDDVVKPDFFSRTTDGSLRYSGDAAKYLKLSTDVDEYWIPSHGETFYAYVTEAEKAKHGSEWGTSKQLCLTNEEIFDIFVEKSKQFILEKPNGIWLNIYQYDGAGFCQCDKCKAEIDKYLISGYYVRFMNRLIDEIEKWKATACPDRVLYYNMPGYHGTVIPPVKATTDENGERVYEPLDPTCIPNEKLYVEFTPLDGCFSHSFDDPSCSVNASYYSNLKGWSAITKNLNVYDYFVNYGAYLNFYNNYQALTRNLELYKELGVKCIFRQNNSGARNKSMDELQNYLYAKLSWDTSESQEELISDFMANYYKNAAPAMSEYLTFLRTFLTEKELSAGNKKGGNYCWRCYTNYNTYMVSSNLWTARVVEKSLDYVDKAYELADSTPDAVEAKIVRNRIMKESVCTRYLYLLNYSTYYQVLGEKYLAEIDEWERDANLTGAVPNEGGSIGSFAESLRARAA